MRPCNLFVPLIVLGFCRPLASQEPFSFDHHVHVLSPRLVGDWKSLGVPFSRADEAYTNPLKILEDGKLSGACLVSMAHLYTMENFASLTEQGKKEAELVAAENDYIAACVEKAADKFVGFFSINPLRPYAMTELRRCTANQFLHGIKIHIPACEIDLQDDAHAARLLEVIDWARQHQQPILLHFSAGERITVEVAKEFWTKFVVPFPKLILILAHGGSAGGFNHSTYNIMNAWQEIRVNAKEPNQLPQVYFETSGIIFVEAQEEFASTTEEHCEQLSTLIQSLGPQQFLFGSDYPVFSVQASRDGLIKKLILPQTVLEQLQKARLPQFVNPTPTRLGIE